MSARRGRCSASEAASLRSLAKDGPGRPGSRSAGGGARDTEVGIRCVCPQGQLPADTGLFNWLRIQESP